METLNQELLNFFLINFVSGVSSEQRIQDFSNDLEKIKSLDEEKRLDFKDKMGYFLHDITSYVREFAIDPVTFKSVVCNRCFSFSNIAKVELLKTICLSEKLSETEKSKRFNDFISGYVFFEIASLKTPILKIISINKTLVKDFILAVMDSKKVIFIDYFGNPIT